MHYHLSVIVPPTGDPEEHVERLMRPYKEYGAECDEEFVTFVVEEHRDEWETGTFEGDYVDGVPEFSWNLRERVGIGMSSRDPLKPGAELRPIPYREKYPTYDGFMRDFHNYEQNDAGAWGYRTNPNGAWDWYQIGGRYSGRLDGYDPDEDPENIETCDLCHGSGRRWDTLARQAAAEGHEKYGRPEGWCNGCDGKGKRPKWPTSRKPHYGDIGLLDTVPDDHTCYAVLEPDGTFSKSERYNPDATDPKGYFTPTPLPTWADLKAKWPGHRIVVVDYHS